MNSGSVFIGYYKPRVGLAPEFSMYPESKWPAKAPRYHQYNVQKSPDRPFIRTAAPLREGDTYTTYVDGEFHTYCVTGFYHDISLGLCPRFEEVHQ